MLIDETTTILVSILSVLFILYAAKCFTIVGQTELHVVEFIGKYSKTINSGWYFLWRPFQSLTKVLSTKIATSHSLVVVKTKDSQFIELPISALTQVKDGFRASYSLENAEATINIMVLNVIRPTAAGLTLDELFSDRTHLLSEAKEKLSAKLSEYGYILVDLLIDQPNLSKEAQQAFNAVLLALKHQQAAVAEGEALKIGIEAQASAEAQSQRLRAQGLADARTILATSLKASIEDLSSIAPEAATNLLLETNRIDALRTMAKESSNLIIVDSSRVNSVIVQANQSKKSHE